MLIEKVVRRLFCAAIVGLVATTGANADYREQLSGRTLDVMVGFSNSGGGARFWSLFSTHMRHHLPDTIIRAEFKDGVLTAQGIEELFEAEPGALTIGLIRPPELAFTQLNSPETMDADLGAAHWLLSAQNLSYIMAARTGLSTDAEELRNQSEVLILPVNDPFATASVVSVLLSAVTDIPARNVVGFGSSARTKALLAGDVDILTMGMDAAVDAVIASGDVVPVYKIVGDDFSALDPTIPDLDDFLRDDAPETVVAFIRAARGMGRAFFAPPGTDPADVAALQQLLEAVVADPAFVQEAQLNGIPVGAKSSAVLTEQMKALVPSDVVARAAILDTFACGVEMSVDPDHSCDF